MRSYLISHFKFSLENIRSDEELWDRKTNSSVYVNTSWNFILWWVLLSGDPTITYQSINRNYSFKFYKWIFTFWDFCFSPRFWRKLFVYKFYLNFFFFENKKKFLLKVILTYKLNCKLHKVNISIIALRENFL